MTAPRPRPPSNPAHGTYARYVSKRHRCRCPECRRAQMRYQERRKLDQLAGRPRTVHAIGAVRRLQALMAIGWSGQFLAAQLGVQRGNLPVHVRYERLSASFAAKVSDLYDELSLQPGPSIHTRGRAREAGFLPPEWWYDVDLDDPAALPVAPDDEDVVDDVAIERVMAGESIRLTRPERRLAFQRLIDQGHNKTEAARLLRINSQTADALLSEMAQEGALAS